jgi:hypothetical protein
MEDSTFHVHGCLGRPWKELVLQTAYSLEVTIIIDIVGRALLLLLNMIDV